MKIINYILLIIVLTSCGKNSFETENGTVVVYIKQGDDNKLADSLISLFVIRSTTDKGQVIMDNNDPIPLKIDPSNLQDQGELFNILPMLKIGDSVTFELGASEFFQKTYRAPLPDSIVHDSKIRFQVAYVDQVTEQNYYEMMTKKTEDAASKQIVIDNQILDDYLAKNNIEAIKTQSGLRYVITEKGTGLTPEQGKMVSVNYTGWVLNGDYFDSSVKEVAIEKNIYNEEREPYVPYSFSLGRGQVIKGWDEGISLLNEKSKARLYIPSTLAYGSSNRNPIIKPNSILVFDVELVKIEN